MAEFALGLTKTAVERTVSLVKSVVEEESELRETVQKDLVFITDEFQMMQSFLRVTKKERVNNEVVLTWVRQLRKLAFDVEDCVEFVIHLDNKSRWRAWLRRMWYTVYCGAPLPPLDAAVAEIKQLKVRVEDVSQRNTRYNLISDSGSKSEGTSSVEEATSDGSSTFDILREVWEDAGKLRGMVDLQELIARPCTDLQVISLWGSTGGDLETKSVLMKVYFDLGICRQFKNRAWVNLKNRSWVKLMHPFNSDEFLRCLLTQFYANSCKENEGIKHLMKAELMQQVNEQRYLIILEEVSSVVEWEAIRMCFPDSQNGSRIVVSTQQLGIARLCTGYPNLVSELRQYSDGQYLYALFRKISVHHSSFDMDELEWQIGCGGIFSVCGRGQRKSVMVRKLVRSMIKKKEEFDGLAFRRYKWVRMVHPFNLKDFTRRLFLHLKPDNFDCLDELDSLDHLQNTELQWIFEMEDKLIEGSRKFLTEVDCLVVINGLQSTDEWDSIKERFFSDTTRSCIIVITQKEAVARHCVEDKKERILQIDDLESKAAEGPVFSSGKEEAHEWVTNFRLVGRLEEQDRLTSLLTHSSVVSVWGVAGVGKSCLVRNIYSRLMLGLRIDYTDTGRSFIHPFPKYSWVDVPHPFNLTDLSRRLLLDFHSHDLQTKEAVAVGIVEGQDTIQVCRRILRQHKCLVVLDGLRSTHDWDLIKATLLPRSTTSCIVVITNEQKVASHCVPTEYRSSQVVNIKGLEPNVALDLFKKIAQVDQSWTEEHMKLSELITAQCGGLPKVIHGVGKCSNDIDQFYRKAKLLSINRGVMGFLNKDHRIHLGDLFGWMQSYFDACSDSLKPCIFYLLVFSADHNIRRSRLLWRWRAEGYSRNSSSMSAEGNGEKLFSELVELSIIQQQGKTLMCHNVFFHEYIISQQMEDNLVFALEGFFSGGLQRSGQHLTIRNGWHRDETVFKSIDFSRLRSLTVCGEWKSFFVNRSLKILRVLDLENTSGVKNGDLEDILKILSRLKFLSLRGCRDINRLPKSLGGLRQLQFLNVKHTSIVAIPLAVVNLEKLQYVGAGTTKSWNDGGSIVEAGDEYRISPPEVTITSSTPPPPPPEVTMTSSSPPPPEVTIRSTSSAPPPRPEVTMTSSSSPPPEVAMTSSSPPTTTTIVKASWCRPATLVSKFHRCRPDYYGVKVPSGIGKVTALHNLGVVNVSGAGGKATLKELKYLLQLRKLGVSGINREKWRELCCAIKDHLHLKSISVRFSEDCLEDKQQLPRYLEILKLSGRVRILPEWIDEDSKDHENSRDLRLAVEMTTSSQSDFDDLAGSPSAPIIRILCVKPNQESISFNLQGWMLEELRIDCTPTLRQVTFVSGNFKQLMINCSSGSSSLRFSGVEELSLLKEVWLMGSYGDELVRDLRQKLDQHLPKPILKLVQPATSC